MGIRSEIQTDEEEEGKAKRRGMSWAQRLKRVFGIDVEVCPHCGGGVRIIACIEDLLVIRQILSPVEAKQTGNRQQAGDLPPSRAPPPFGLCFLAFRSPILSFASSAEFLFPMKNGRRLR